jgi:hypothetical protein
VVTPQAAQIKQYVFVSDESNNRIQVFEWKPVAHQFIGPTNNTNVISLANNTFIKGIDNNTATGATMNNTIAINATAANATAANGIGSLENNTTAVNSIGNSTK